MNQLVWLSTNFKLELGKGTINFNDDQFRVILLTKDFNFDENITKIYSDIKNHELPTLHGYKKADKILDIDAPWSVNESSKIIQLKWKDVMFITEYGNIGPFRFAVILKWNHSDIDSSLVLGCIDFTQDIIIEDGLSYKIKDLYLTLKQGFYY